VTTFIIGAGFTKAVFPDAPLNADLLDVLAKRSRDSAALVLRDRYRTHEIEIALMRLDADIASARGEYGPLVEEIRNLRQRIETELGLARIKLVRVPYKGGGPMIVDVVAGQVPVTFGTAASVSPHTKSGRLRGLAVTAGKRSAVLPDLPTIAESGLPGYEMLNWLGLFAPSGTPRVVVEKLSAEAVRIVSTPEVRDRFNAQGAEPSPLAMDAFTAFVKSGIEKWAKVVAATGMTVE